MSLLARTTSSCSSALELTKSISDDFGNAREIISCSFW